jgi:diguanylate cyclase (GGDEF)-like protein
MKSNDDSKPTPVRTHVALPGNAEAGDTPVLVAIRGPRCGRMFTARPAAVIGRDEGADVSLRDLAVSRRHAALFMDEERRWSIQDLGSKNGTRLNGKPVYGRCELADGDRIALGAGSVLVFSRPGNIGEHIEHASMERARRDRLTGALSRRVFEEELAREFSYARRHHEPLSLLLLDLDHFKRVNEDCGFAAGDTALMAVSAIVHSWVRAGDLVARFAGDEFAVLCRGVSEDRAVLLAHRLKNIIADEHIRVAHNERVALTASVGAASYPRDQAATAFQLLAAADRALDVAKAWGPNRVAVPAEAPS